MSIWTLMPLHQSLGLAVIGIDLSEPIDAETGETLSRLLAEHLVLVFPDQTLTPEQYLAAARAFGPPMHRDLAPDALPGYPDIRRVEGDGGGATTAGWQAEDVGHDDPPAAAILYAVEVPASGGATSIANMRAAYWALSEEERLHLETLRTVNPRDDKHGSGADDATGALAAVHPMVRTHPLSRERALYFHPTRATYIEGMTPEASREYLADLVMRTIEPAIVYDHNWVKGDVLVIDTRATLNRSADDFEPGESRILWRIVVEGDRPSLR
jgi:taurine dioxygenase